VRHQQKSQSHPHILPAGELGYVSEKVENFRLAICPLRVFLLQLTLALQRRLQLILSIKKGANKKINRRVENK
jgi:hypothetical protein